MNGTGLDVRETHVAIVIQMDRMSMSTKWLSDIVHLQRVSRRRTDSSKIGCTNLHVRQTYDGSLLRARSIQIGTGHDRGAELLQTDFIAHSRQITFRSLGLF